MNALAEQNSEQQKNIRPQLIASLQQAKAGNLQDFNAVFNRLEKKYSQLANNEKKYKDETL